jgi:hypothetical protein
MTMKEDAVMCRESDAASDERRIGEQHSADERN